MNDQTTSSLGNSTTSLTYATSIRIIVNTRTSTNVTIIRGPGQNHTVPELISGGGIEFVEVLDLSLIPVSYGMSFGNISNTGIRVKTSSPSSIQAVVSIQANIKSDIWDQREGTIVFPVNTLGTRYFVNGDERNQAFSVVAVNDVTDVAIRHPPTGSVRSFSLNALQSLSYTGIRLSGLIIESSQPVAVFSGCNCADRPTGVCIPDKPCSYLWEQLPRQEDFGSSFIFVNPDQNLNNELDTSLYFVNKETFPVIVRISGQAPFTLKPNGGLATVQITNLTHSIVANGQIDVQVISGSPRQTNRTQFGLIPNAQFIDQALFCIRPAFSSQLIIVAWTSDITKPRSSLKFNGQAFDLTRFQPTADPNLSVAIASGLFGPFVMDSSFGVAVYLFEYDNSTSHFGSIIGRNL